MIKLVIKYKARLEPVHIFELHAFGDLLGSTMTKMIINYDPYACGSWVYKSELVHFINLLCRTEMERGFQQNFYMQNLVGLEDEDIILKCS